MENCIMVIAKHSNVELLEMLKEIDKIGNSEAPALEKMTLDLAYLFKLETTEYNNWSNRYFRIKLGIETEILTRIKKDIIVVGDSYRVAKAVIHKNVRYDAIDIVNKLSLEFNINDEFVNKCTKEIHNMKLRE